MQPGPPPTLSWFVVESGPQTGQSFLLPDGDFILGKGPPNLADVIVLDEALAPAHLVFRHERGELVAYDAQLIVRSDGRRRTRWRVRSLFRLLHNGSEFLAGRTRITYRTITLTE